MRPVRLVHEALLAAAERVPEKRALATREGELTYGELADLVLSVSAGLRDVGVGRGDRVVISMRNSLELAAALYATSAAGGVFVVINPQMKQDKLAYILNDSGATAIVADGPHIATAVRAAAEAPSVKAVVAVGTTEPSAVSWEALAETAPRAPEAAVPVDLAALIYTSGSTGEPKGVMMTHQNVVFTTGSLTQYLRLGEDERILNVLPLAFDYGLYQLLMSVSIGATLVLESSFAFPLPLLERIADEQITVFPGVPTVYATLLGLRGEVGSYPSVRRVTNTAASLPPSFHDDLRGLFPNALIFRMYGLTECKRVSYLEPELLDEKPTSVGKAIPGTEAFVLDEAGRPVKPGETGILHVRGPHVMAGYWNEPELTAHMIKEGRFPGDRMLCTHDRFTVDEDGFLYFVGRTDDIIKTRGEKVSPIEVENALFAIEGIREAAVIGVSDDVLGEAIRAYVVLESWAELTERDVIRAAGERLEPYMIPREVVFVPELEHTSSGKIRRPSPTAPEASETRVP
jgi:long-chain acyl-CoA synthetase